MAKVLCRLNICRAPGEVSHNRDRISFNAEAFYKAPLMCHVAKIFRLVFGLSSCLDMLRYRIHAALDEVIVWAGVTVPAATGVGAYVASFHHVLRASTAAASSSG